MQFTIRNNAANYNYMKARIILDAKLIIINHKLTANEFKLNNYLLNNFKVDLKAASLYLLKHCKLYKSLDNSITVLFLNKKADTLAALITYGNNEIPGSNILTDAFCRKD